MIRDTLVTPVETFEGGHSIQRQDLLAVEEPLEIRLAGQTVSITMRTPGHDFDLVAGFLITEGILQEINQIVSIHYEANDRTPRQSGNTVVVEIARDVQVDLKRLQRNFHASSSCGICGKVCIDALTIQTRRSIRPAEPVFAPSIIHHLPETLRRSQAVFERTGGLHAAALFAKDGCLLALREDVGRHNAVDKLIGFAMRDSSIHLDDSLLFVSGRAGFELVQKALVAGIPILAAVGAPSSLAVEAAQRFGMTLLGFVRGDRFNVYSGAARLG